MHGCVRTAELWNARSATKMKRNEIVLNRLYADRDLYHCACYVTGDVRRTGEQLAPVTYLTYDMQHAVDAIYV